MPKIYILLLLCFQSFYGFSQGLTLTSGTKVKTFKPGSWYEVVVNGKYNGAQPCDKLYYKGTLAQTSPDSLTMNTGRVILLSVVESKIIEHEMVFPGQKNKATFAVEDIQYLEHYTSEKAQKRKRVFAGVGGVLLATGAVTALHALAVDGSANRRTLLISGGIQFGLGITLGFSSTTKRYYFRDKEEVWKVVFK